MRKDDSRKNAASTRSEPPSPSWARSCYGNKIIIITDASDSQIIDMLKVLCGPEQVGIPQ